MIVWVLIATIYFPQEYSGHKAIVIDNIATSADCERAAAVFRKNGTAFCVPVRKVKP